MTSKKRGSLVDESEIAAAMLVSSHPTFNLQRYIGQYVGVTRIKRLQWIGLHTEGDLQLNAFRQSITEAKRGLNYQIYEQCVGKAIEALQDNLGQEYFMDPQWVDSTRRSGHAQYTQLEAVLKEAKRIGEREPIRVAYIAVADHQMKQGDFQKALTNYMDTKDHGVTVEHKMTTCLNIIKAAIALGSFTHVKGQVNSVKKKIITGNVQWKSQVSASLGLYFLKTGNFRDACTQFRNCNVVMKNYNHIISIKDIAVYGSFCALASYSRENIKRMLDEAEWKKFLELCPIWKQIMLDYLNSSYAECFEKIERQKNNLLLDMYVAPHFFAMQKKIRDRAFQQYFSPFKSVRIPSMAKAFNLDIPVVERYLVKLITENKVQGRIDSHNKILYSRVADQRSATYQESLELGDRYVRDVKSLLMRMSLIKADMVVRSQPKRSQNFFSRGGDNLGALDDEKKKSQLDEEN